MQWTSEALGGLEVALGIGDSGNGGAARLLGSLRTGGMYPTQRCLFQCPRVFIHIRRVRRWSCSHNH